LNRIFGIKNGSGIPLPMGVPEIGTKNRNSQPRMGIVLLGGIDIVLMISNTIEEV
jgi:hypothetical protein